tara:strand:- start:372 stop:527 length:156 start_codon:yes stop_codon:yes gene_type:complete
MLMALSKYWYIYDQTFDTYAMSPEEREEIISLHASDNSICCVEEHIETLED